MTSRLWREVRSAGIGRLRAAAEVDDPEQELRWIIEQVGGHSGAEQAAALDDVATEREWGHVEEMVGRRAAGEPLQYVLGRWGFRTLDLLVDRRVLIPRPETEVVAGLAIDALAALGRPGIAVDLGTGSGAIALSLAAERWPDVEVWATDESADALSVARANLAGLGRRAAVVRVVEGDWFGALPSELRGRIDVIVSNPPYVAEGEPLPDGVAEWEPRAALVPGPSGLEAIEHIVAEAPGWLTGSGTLVVEIGATQTVATGGMARAAGFHPVTIHQDLAGHDRVLVARAAAGGRAGHR